MTEQHNLEVIEVPYIVEEVPSANPKRCLIMDSQILTSVQSCAWKTNLTFVRKLRLIGNVPEAIERGDLSHKMFERYYLHLKNEVSFQDAVEDVIEYGRAYYPSLDLDVSESEWVIETFKQYTNHYRFDGLKVHDVEKPFMFKIYEDDDLIVYYAGKIDLVADVPLVGVVPFDHKNRARKNDETQMNNQFIGYAIAVDSPIVYVNEVGLQHSKTPDDKFRRMPLSYTSGMKKLWLENTIYWARQLDLYLQTDTWPLQINPYICKGCVFMNVCTSDSKAMMEHKLSTQYYVNDKWDVTTELGLENAEVTDKT